MRIRIRNFRLEKHFFKFWLNEVPCFEEKKNGTFQNMEGSKNSELLQYCFKFQNSGRKSRKRTRGGSYLWKFQNSEHEMKNHIHDHMQDHERQQINIKIPDQVCRINRKII